MESFYYVIKHQIVLKLLECHLWVVDCQSELRITVLESFYYVIKHQIVLKLLECYPGVVDCQSELKLFCGNRELSNPKSQTEEVEYEILSAFIL